jgi:hypothetical protein
MKEFARYDPETGKVLAVGLVPENMVDLQTGPIYIGSADPTTQYIVNDVICERPEFDIRLSGTTVKANGLDSLVVSNVPIGTFVSVSGPTSISSVTDAEEDISMTFVVPGQYVLTMENFPFQEMKVTINAT